MSYNYNSVPNPSRSALFGPGAGGRGLDDMGSAGWGSGSTEDEEPEDTRSYSVPQLKQQQYQILEQQDRGLEALSEVISRQKQIATVIGGEVTYQNELLDDITDHVDRTRDRLVGETNRVRTIDRKDNTCGYWVVIVLLLLAIVVIVSV